MTQWSRIKIMISLIQKITKCLFLGYYKGNKLIGYCICKLKNHKIETFYSLRIAQVFEAIWKCIQVGEMKALWWPFWTNHLNHFCVITLRSAMSKREIMWLQMKKQSKYPHGMTAAMRDSVKLGDILRGSKAHLESGGIIIFSPTRQKTNQCNIIR